MQYVKLPQKRYWQAIVSICQTILTTVFIILLVPLSSKAQCTYSGNGFDLSATQSCLVKGQSVDLYIPYRCFDSIPMEFTDPVGNTYPGSHMYLFRIDSIYNLPAGLSASLSLPDALTPEETGCIHIAGTPTGAQGWYYIQIKASFKILDIPVYTHENVLLNSIIPEDRQIILRLYDPGVDCAGQKEYPWMSFR